MIDNKTIREYTILNKIVNGGTHTGYETKTASGSIASFETNTDKNLIECKTSITPIQDTGIPSPNNPLPISGHTGLTITRTGANIFGGSVLKDGIVASMPSATVDLINKTVTFSSSATVNQRITDGYVSGKFKENTQYTFILALEKTSGVGSNLRIYYTDGTYTAVPNISTPDTKEIKTVVSTSGKTVNYLSKTNQAGSTVVYYDESGIFEGDLTAQDFEPYTATTYPVSWSEQGTVYGGDIDIITGIGKSKLGFITFDGSEDWDLYYPQDGFAISIPDMKIGSAMDGYCNILPVIKTSSQFGVRLGGSINDNKIYCCRIVGAIEGVTNVDTWKAFLSENNLTICYPLATEEDISIDPETISTINGINNIWSDTGDMEVKYLYEVEVITSGVMKYLPFFYDFKGRRKDL